MNKEVLTKIIYSEEFKRHSPSNDSPEIPERLDVIVKELQEQEIINLEWINYVETIDLSLLKESHDPRYIQKVKRAAESVKGKNYYLDNSKETYVSSESYLVCLNALGAIINTVETAKDTSERTHFFCLVRPPGHHASWNAGSGFCIFNNIVVAANYASKHMDFRSILIIDFDIHRGDGTEKMLKKAEDTAYLGMSAVGHFPGKSKTIGVSKIRNNMKTITLPLSATHEDVERLFIPEIKSTISEISPDLILVSAGFDGLETDSMSTTQFKPNTYELISSTISQSSDCSIISILEGGYDLDSLGGAVLCYLKGYS